jgi:hypothetical protein
MLRIFDQPLMLLWLLAGVVPLLVGGGEVALRLGRWGKGVAGFWAYLFVGAAVLATVGALVSLLAGRLGWGG